MYLEISHLSDVGLLKIFSHSESFLFVSLTVFFALQKLLSFSRSHLCIVAFRVCKNYILTLATALSHSVLNFIDSSSNSTLILLTHQTVGYFLISPLSLSNATLPLTSWSLLVNKTLDAAAYTLRGFCNR